MRAVATNAGATAVSIGTFDGVHLGHQAILAEVRAQAEARGIASAAYAFRLPPRRQLSAAPHRALLLPENVKVRLLLGAVDRVVRAPFHDIRNLSPNRFAEEVLVVALHAASVVVGPSFRFGAGRAGDPETLASLGERHGFAVIVVPPVDFGDVPISSTRIRSLVAAGDVAGAAAMLGRPPVLIGDVTGGDRIGRTLGYPTANLAVDSQVLLPKHGVYAARAFLGDAPSPRPALLYVGARPTIGSAEAAPRCEVHLLGAAHDLYGARIEVHLLERLRDDRAFASLEDLRHQIDRDAARGRKILERLRVVSTPIAG